MKKLFTTSIIVFVCFSAFAQFEKGRILAGGSVGFSATTNKTKTDNATNTNSKTTSFSLSPRLGYFFIDNLAGGLELDMSTSSTKDDGSNDKDTYSSLTFSPFVRYYLQPGIFFQGQYGIGPGSSKSENGSTTIKTKYTNSNWSLGVGYAHFLAGNVAIEPFIGYGAESRKAKSSDIRNVNSGLFINIGFQIYLDRKK
jgi:outer membrane protein